MATGDDALAAGMALMTGTEQANTLDTQMNLTRDYIAQRTSAVTPVTKGGTGATAASAARTNLGISAANTPATGAGGADVQSWLTFLDNVKVSNVSAGTNLVQLGWSGGRLVIFIDSTNQGGVATTNDLGGKVNKSGDTMSGDLFIPGASPASSGWSAAYIDGSGRICRGASSLRYKKHISEIAPSAFGNIFPPLKRFQMRGGDGRWTYGHIAEELAADPDTEQFVMYDGEGRPDSVDYVPLLLAKVEQLSARVEELTARLTDIEGA